MSLRSKNNIGNLTRPNVSLELMLFLTGFIIILLISDLLISIFDYSFLVTIVSPYFHISYTIDSSLLPQQIFSYKKTLRFLALILLLALL